jgi:hypothetical protein
MGYFCLPRLYRTAETTRQPCELWSVVCVCVCCMLFYVDHKNVVTGLTFSITGIRQMTKQKGHNRKIVPQVIRYRLQTGCVVLCIDKGQGCMCQDTVID